MPQKWVKSKIQFHSSMDWLINQWHKLHQTWNLQRIWWQLWHWAIARLSTQNSRSLISRASVALWPIIIAAIAVPALITISIIPAIASVRPGVAQMSQRITDKIWLASPSLVIWIWRVWRLYIKWQNRGKNVVSKQGTIYCHFPSWWRKKQIHKRLYLKTRQLSWTQAWLSVIKVYKHTRDTNKILEGVNNKYIYAAGIIVFFFAGWTKVYILN